MLDGNKIRRLREAAELTHEELGRKVGLSQSMISFLESNLKETNTTKAALIAKALGVTVNDLLKTG